MVLHTRYSLLAAIFLTTLLGCRKDDDLAVVEPVSNVPSHLTYDMLSDAVYQRFEAERDIDNLGPNAYKLRRGLTARTADSVTRRTLGELMLAQFGNEAGLVQFLDEVGEPAFEYGMYPGETLRENVAIVPMVNDRRVTGYVFYAIATEGSPQPSYIDYVENNLLTWRAKLPITGREKDELGYLWTVLGPAVQIEYWMLGTVDTSLIRYLINTDSLQASGALHGRSCNGQLVRSCYEQPETLYRPSSDPGCLYDDNCAVVEQVFTHYTFVSA